jgi:hypothetical protein
MVFFFFLPAQPFFEALSRGDFKGLTSVVTIAEVSSIHFWWWRRFRQKSKPPYQ